MVEVTIRMNFPSGTKVPDGVNDVIEKAVQLESASIIEVSGPADRAALQPKAAVSNQAPVPLPAESGPVNGLAPPNAMSSYPPSAAPAPLSSANLIDEATYNALKSKHGRKTGQEKEQIAAYEAHATAQATAAAASQLPAASSSPAGTSNLPPGITTIPAALDARLPGQALPGSVAPPPPSSLAAPAPPAAPAAVPAAPPPPVIDPNGPLTLDSVKAAYQQLFNMPNASSVAFTLLNGSTWPGTGGAQKASWFKVEDIPEDNYKYFVHQVNYLAGLVASGQPIPA